MGQSVVHALTEEHTHECRNSVTLMSSAERRGAQCYESTQRTGVTRSPGFSEEVTSDNERKYFLCSSRGKSDAKFLPEQGGYGFT